MQNVLNRKRKGFTLFSKKTRGFTLIELIVVIAIIGILVLLAMPKFMDYTRDAKDAKTQHDARVADDAVTEHLIGNNDKFEEELTDVPPVDIQAGIEEGRVYGPGGPVAEVPEGPYYDVTDLDEVKAGGIKTDGTIISNKDGDVFIILDKAIRTDICVLRADQKIETDGWLHVIDTYTHDNYPDTTFYETDMYGFVFIREESNERSGAAWEFTIVDYRGLDDNLKVPGLIQMNHTAGGLDTGYVTAIDMTKFDEKNLTIAELPCTITGTMVSDSGGTEICLDMTAQEATDAGFGFDGVGTIIGYSGTATDIEIPCTINGVEVTVIGDMAFYNKNLTSITIPDSLIEIGEGALADNSLTSVIIPNSVTTIKNWAFTMNNLTSVDIPNSVTIIGEAVFRHNNLTSVIIPNSVTTLKYNVFANNSLTSITIPDNMTTIGGWAFAENNLTGVDIPNSVTTIGENAFTKNDLTSLTIGNNVTTIQWGAFSNNGLTSIAIPDSVTTIAYQAFQYNNLTSIGIGNNVTAIGHQAFSENGPGQNSGNFPETSPWTGIWTLPDGGTIWELQQ